MTGSLGSLPFLRTAILATTCTLQVVYWSLSMHISGTSDTLNIKIYFLKSESKNSSGWPCLFPEPKSLGFSTALPECLIFFCINIYWSVQNWIALLSITVQALRPGRQLSSYGRLLPLCLLWYLCCRPHCRPQCYGDCEVNCVLLNQTAANLGTGCGHAPVQNGIRWHSFPLQLLSTS